MLEPRADDSGEQLLFMPFTNSDLSVMLAVTANALILVSEFYCGIPDIFCVFGVGLL